VDPAIGELGVERLVELAMHMLGQVKARDGRVRVDSGSVNAVQASRAVASSTGVRVCESRAQASANLFGMAVDGAEVGSMDYDSVAVLAASELAADIERLCARFSERCLGALGARKGESFRGTALLSPEVVRSLLLGNLLPTLSAQAVRTGRSPLAGRVGEAIASPQFTLVDDGRLAGGTGSVSFDREGMPTRRTPLIESGVLSGFLYDLYEARAASAQSTGSARGGAADLPRIGPCNLLVEPGETPYAELCREPERAVLVQRFSGSSSSVTGEFSGVVKGSFLLRRGERVPVRETLIAGNLYDVLRSISGISKEVQSLQGSAFVPALRVEGISVTTG
jgi:PmbA protein